MFHLCLFGGQGGQLSSERKVYFTMFGACELKLPTTAKQMLEMRRSGKPSPAHFFVTLFGGTSITSPTLAQEYLDLQNALRSGQLNLDDWDRSIVQIGNASRSASLTLFGAFGADELPSEDDELEDLALNRHLGYVSDEASELLMRAVGQGGSSRGAVVRQAIAVTLAQPSHPTAVAQAI